MPPRCAVLPFLTQRGGRSLLVVSYIPFPIQRGGVCLLVVPFLLNGIFLILLNQILTNSIVTHEITVSRQLRPPPLAFRVAQENSTHHPPLPCISSARWRVFTAMATLALAFRVTEGNSTHHRPSLARNTTWRLE